MLLLSVGEGVPDWPYYPVLAKFLEGRGDFGDNSYDAGSHSYTEPEARPGASHHHPGLLCLCLLLFKYIVTLDKPDHVQFSGPHSSSKCALHKKKENNSSIKVYSFCLNCCNNNQTEIQFSNCQLPGIIEMSQ